MSAAEPTPGLTIAHVPTTPEFPHANPPLASWTRAAWLRTIVIEVIAATVAAGADAALAAPLLAVVLSAGDANASGPGLAVVAFPLAFVSARPPSQQRREDVKHRQTSRAPSVSGDDGYLHSPHSNADN